MVPSGKAILYDDAFCQPVSRIDLKKTGHSLRVPRSPKVPDAFSEQFRANDQFFFQQIREHAGDAELNLQIELALAKLQPTICEISHMLLLLEGAHL